MDRTSRITTLVENTAGRDGLLGEHGLAFWIEWGEERVLFDTGQGGVLAGNASKLGVKLEQTGAVVLSHGHYDHTGGLAAVLAAATMPASAAARDGASAYPTFARPTYSVPAAGSSRRRSPPRSARACSPPARCRV